MIIDGEIILEEIDPANNEWLRTQRNKPEMRKHFREWKDISAAQQQKWYESRGNNSNPEHVYFQIMKCPQRQVPDDEPLVERYIIGCEGLHYIDWRLGSAEFSVFIDNAEHGRGYGTQALKMMFNYGFSEMNLHKIWAECYDNNPAIDLYRKLGFVDEGVLRHNYYHEGKYGNSYRISLLRSEWDNLDWRRTSFKSE